ncbi:MAG: hypothetical protein ACI4VK_04780 [Candidatus Coproplasma sp.]
MKKSKIFKSLIALSCCLTMGLGALTGCGSEPECEHVYTWTVTKESTCAEQGVNTGVCGLCGDVKEEKLPINENAHVFTGEWAITPPTEEEDGVAVKTCANNPEHKLEITLPKVTITGSGYDSKEFITVPTTAREGEMKLTLKNTYGDITFTAQLAKRKLDNLEDAVILASSLKENVRQANGWFRETADGMQHTFSYYFGDDYTHIVDSANNKESWYSLDDNSNVFAMSEINGSAATVDADNDAGYLNGYHYNSSVATSSFYGAEQGLAKLYETAMNGLNGGIFEETGATINYKEISKDEINDDEHKSKDGSRNNLWFSYSYNTGSWFARFKVTFSVYPDGTLKELEVETEVIRSYMFATDLEGAIITYKDGDESVVSGKATVGDIIFGYDYPIDYNTGNSAYEYDEVGNYVYEQTNKATGNVVYYDGEYYYDVVGGNSVAQSNGTISYETVYNKLDYIPELEPVYVKDKFGMTVLDDKGNPIPKIMAAGGYPVDSWYSDDHPEVSYKTVNIKQTKKVTQEDVDNGLEDEADVVIANPYPYDSLYIRDFDITGASSGNSIDLSGGFILPADTAITFKLGNISPSTANFKTDTISNIYIKDATGALIRLKLDLNNGSQYKVLGFFTRSDETVTIRSQYAGTLTFVFETQGGKCKKEVEMTFTKSAPTSLTASANVYGVANGKVDYRESSINTTDRAVSLIVGQPLRFWANASASEAAYVSTDILPVADREGVTLSQNEEGSYKEWKLIADEAGEYIITMPYYDGTTSSETVYAQFKVKVTAKTKPMELLSGNTFSGSVLILEGTGSPKPKTLTAEFTTETVDDVVINIIKINVGGVNGNDLVYTYRIGEDDELITEYMSGTTSSENKSYDFTFSIDEADNLIINHSTGFGSNKEDIVLTKVVEE